jgi:aspartate carbamoyltransferase
MHEHPTQELLDEYTFLDHNKQDRDHIHLVLEGDLKHGRTTHSKADGLKIFKDVEVDLIAPPGLEMPKEYMDKMTANNYKIQSFPSISEYLANKENIAPIRYFTRPQLERM